MLNHHEHTPYIDGAFIKGTIVDKGFNIDQIFLFDVTIHEEKNDKNNLNTIIGILKKKFQRNFSKWND